MKLKYLIVDRDETIGNFDRYRTSGEIILNPGIKSFLEQACQDNFITVMATGGITETIEEMNQAAGIKHLLDYTFGWEKLRTPQWWKDISNLEKELGKNAFDNAVMIGNQTDVYCCPYRIPIFHVNFDPGKEYWNTQLVYSLIKRLFENNTTPANNFDQLFTDNQSPVVEEQQYKFEEERMPIADVYNTVQLTIQDKVVELQKHHLSAEKTALYQRKYPKFNPEEYNRRVIVI